MQLNFFKYQGTGNDFVMIDNRKEFFPKENVGLVSFLCDRRFGIGADGLILLENDEDTDFKMVYYNSDGRQGTMCGNGGRCIVAFAHYLGVVDQNTSFMAVDGLHNAIIANGIVSLEMQNVKEIKEKSNSLFLNTGSPHHVQLVDGLKDFDVRKEGAKLRYGLYGEQGSNINFVDQATEDTFNVRTYERGVEDETFSCGTGVTAVALAMHHSGKTNKDSVKIITPGGNLQVKFKSNANGYDNIWLTGPAQLVFKGEINVES
ncbi:diaminopimelate epimerase [Arenibacter algicola]|jgi:diaminopimelate epimerase|uniref:Diaminopimelate epimerase n=1 Tax=Arenibacter algicola TaxID=616991 RepID=A0A221V3B0_9FLAO|nr:MULTISPECIES: diaminopimelate epimerase [Arenibacter]ASO08074.1 diaminopimelate epimerase [Arenibacter algicola]MDX1758325.1 diaminopimelate epimerase [Arenibacter algicola]GBF21467.1 diaminopimelate epimerase [Arenibacter sp. NBRC 103722]HCO86085.1 diaminopimelate epimerase [Arenibacter sp.]|tara:strand:- start:15791 stop:16573 length:783 start_codon:yes stop_codon:yes gene_type:complete